MIIILRHYGWNKIKMEEQWFDNMPKLAIEIGIRFDLELVVDHPEISNSLKQYNKGICPICYCDFDGEADQLVCGHQYCTDCWGMYLKDKINSGGSACVLTKCPQAYCNVIVPHSHFVKYVEKEAEFKKYKKWLCKQFVEHSKYII